MQYSIPEAACSEESRDKKRKAAKESVLYYNGATWRNANATAYPKATSVDKRQVVFSDGEIVDLDIKYNETNQATVTETGKAPYTVDIDTGNYW